MVKSIISAKGCESMDNVNRILCGAVLVTSRGGFKRRSLPSSSFFESDMLVASHYWSRIKVNWIEINKDIEFPTFMSMRAQNRFRCSEAAPFLWAVLLNGKPCMKWETADSQRGYVDLWHREATSQRTVRNRLFGRVKFVKIQ